MLPHGEKGFLNENVLFNNLVCCFLSDLTGPRGSFRSLEVWQGLEIIKL